MQILDIEIKTPYDTPLNYEADWRFKVASILSAENNYNKILPSELINDKIILNTSRYLKYIKENGTYLPETYKPYHAIVLWYEDTKPLSVKQYLEPLLLTDRTYCGIGKDLGLDESLIHLYEQVFFNVRDNKGQSINITPLKLRFAYGELSSIEEVQEKKNKGNFYAEPIEWKIAAVKYGYPVLATMWSLPGGENDTNPEANYYKIAATLNRGLILTRTFRGQISNYDINQAQANYIDYQRLQHDIAKDNKELNAGARTGNIDPIGMKILKMMAPKMIPTVLTVEQIEEQNKALHQKLLVENKIKETEIVDKGISVAGAELNEGIKKQLSH